MSKIKLATTWLDGCAGCHMSLLDIDERIIALAEKVQLVYGPLVDTKEFPEDVDVTLVEGAVSNQDDLKLIQIIRQRSRLVVSLGDCAVTSNVPSMRNAIGVRPVLERAYIENVQENAQIPCQEIPALLSHARPVHEIVKVDLHIPGCPPSADLIFDVIIDVLEGNNADFGSRYRFG